MMTKIKIYLTIVFFIFISLSITNCSRNIFSPAKEKLIKINQFEPFFNLSLKYLGQVEDTLSIQFVITNSDSTEAHLLYMGYLYQTFNIKNDTSLLTERKIIHTRFNLEDVLENQNKFENCERILSNTNKFTFLKPLNSYSFNVSQVVNGLNKKPVGYNLTVEGSLYVNEEISKYCYKVWSGKMIDTVNFNLK